MEATMYCLVDPRGAVYAKDGAVSFAEVAGAFGVGEDECQGYRFDLTTRRLRADRGQAVAGGAAREYLDKAVGSPDRLMAFAVQGHLPKEALAALLQPAVRQQFLDACGRVEREYTDACIATRDACLASGCSVEGEDESCLQPLLEAGPAYHRACAAEWIKLFSDPGNRIDTWKQ